MGGPCRSVVKPKNVLEIQHQYFSGKVMALILDVDGGYCHLWVPDEEQWREANVPYTLNHIPWFEKHPHGYYIFRWGDVPIVRHLFSQLDMEISLTKAAYDKWVRWHEHLNYAYSGVQLAGSSQPREYQHRTVLFARHRNGCLIGHDQGVGKSLCGFTSALDKFQFKMIDHAILVSPASVIDKWAQDISECLPPPYNSVTMIEGSDTETQWITPTRWHLLSYAKARDEADVLYKLVRQGRVYWKKNLLLADELHFARTRFRYVKGGGKKRVKQTAALQLLGRMSEHRVGLTAQKTRALEHLFEMFETLDPEFFHSWDNFSSRYMVYNPAVPGAVGYQREDELAMKLPMLVLSYKKQDVLPDLPPLTFEDRWVQLDDREMKLYKKYVSKGLFDPDTMDSDKRISKQNALTILTSVKRFLASPKLVNEKWKKTSAKMTELKYMLQGNEEKVVIFSQYADVVDMITETLGEDKCFKYYKNAKKTMWQDYLLQDDKPYFVMTTKGKVGIDLHGIWEHYEDESGKTQKRWKWGAGVIVMFDELTDPSDNDQVHNRINRYVPDDDLLSQLRSHVIRLRCKGTYEERLVKILADRTEFAKRLESGQATYRELQKLIMG